MDVTGAIEAAAQLPWPSMALCAASVTILILVHQLLRKPTIYLLDFIAQRPDDSWSHSRAHIEESAVKSNYFEKEQFNFQRKVLYSSGLGNETYSPNWMHEFPQDTSTKKARLEFEMIAINAISDLLKQTGITAKQIGCVVVNSSVFAPTPSLAAQVINHFKMGSKTIHYNLGGMGCAASPIAVDCARQVLMLKSNTYALVVSTEIITRGVYKGTQRSMLVPNVLFRSGGAVMLLTNKRSESWRSKYVLQHLVRTNVMAEDAAYGAAQETEDAEGNKGIKLSRELPKIAAAALQLNLSELAPKVLPWSEKLVFAANWTARKLLGYQDLKPYRPDLQKAAQHICIHAGGKAVIDGIKGELSLNNHYVEPSRASLYRYGNTSSSSLWYVLAYIEHFRGLRRGDKVLQLAFGSGFKCNTVVWVANRTFKQQHRAWEGFNLDAMYADLKTMEVQLKQLLLEMAADAAEAEAAQQQQQGAKPAIMRSISEADIKSHIKDQAN